MYQDHGGFNILNMTRLDYQQAKWATALGPEGSKISVSSVFAKLIEHLFRIMHH